MKQLLIILLCYSSIGLMAQRIDSDHVNYIILFQNESKEILEHQEIIATNVEDKTEIHKKFTTSKGRVKFVLKRGATYQIAYLNESFEVTIPKSGLSFLTKKVTYQADSETLQKSSSDTVTFSKIPRQATATAALFQLIVKDKRGKPFKDFTVNIVQSTIQKTYQATTNHRGQAAFLLPIGYEYSLNLGSDINYTTVRIPNKPYLQLKKGIIYVSRTMNIKETEQNDTIYQEVPLTQKPTLKRNLVKVTVLDLDGNPLEDEKVYFQNPKKVYTATTNSDGEAALMLPKGAYYAVNFEYKDSLEVLHLPKGRYTRTDKIRYKYIGSKAIKARILERKRNEAMWDSLAQIQSFRDSLAALRSPFSNFSRHWSKLTPAELNEMINQRAEADWQALKANPKYLEEIGDEVAAAFYRNKDKWEDKLIISDLTCSMHPYLDQILAWHVLELKFKEQEAFENQYMFFNDGNGKPMHQKIIGKTGGFHYTDAKKLEQLSQTMKETMSTGCSIDGPENDLEALLDGVQNRRLKNMEIILIADNNSEIRDFELLKSLNVPIKVVLAGTFWGVNEQYLELAFHTKGSIHTIEEDLERLFELNDGDYISIGEERYRIYKGQFLKENRL